MSYVQILDTAISSALIALVTAMKISSSVAAAPPEPSKATAASGSTRPAVTSAGSIREGYVGKTGLLSNARADKPMVVAHRNGMANHDRPPAT